MLGSLTIHLAVCALGLGCAGVLLPEGDLLRDVYLRGSPSTATVALTFDDGPNGRCTEAVLDALRDVGAPGAFFVLGENIARGRDDTLLVRMVREGHTIGVHSETHGVRPLFLRAATVEELNATRTAVYAALARAGIAERPAVTLFRPPFGFLTQATARAAADAGFHIVEWTVSVGDWKGGRHPEEITDAILARVRPGDVIVLHDGDRTHHRSLERCRDRPNAAATVRLLVPALRARGLTPAPLPEILGLAAEARATTASCRQPRRLVSVFLATRPSSMASSTQHRERSSPGSATGGKTAYSARIARARDEVDP